MLLLTLSSPALLPRRAAIDLAASAGVATLLPPLPAAAKAGTFANMDGSKSSMAAGDASNACLFAQPGSGICMVYESSEPKLYSTPDQRAALDKLRAAAEKLSGLGELIASSRWTAISQLLGGSRDLREAVGFLTDDDVSKKAAKKVFLDLDGVALGASKRDGKAAQLYFASYSRDMPELLKLLR